MKKEILILGGSQFMGRMLVEQLLAEGKYEITLFNRGKTNPDLFPDVKRIIGDRETEDSRRILRKWWEAIIDFSCYHPNSFEELIQGLKGNVGRYIFVSTVSVYRQDPKMVKNEDAPILDCTIEQRAEKKITGENYGAKKAECERILAANDWLDSIILRPAIVYGPHDYTQRLYYWMYRIKNLNQVIVPGKGEELMNMTYAEDIVTLMKKCLDIPVHRKIYNTTTHAPNSLLDKLKSMAKALGKSPDWLFVDPKQILDNKEVLGGKIPQVYTTSNQYRFDHSKMLEDFGEFLTPFDTSIAETIKWHDSNKLWEEGKAGPTIEQEAAFLKTLKI